MNIAYVRVSTELQNEQRQIDTLEKYNIDKWFIEKISAKDTNRPKLKEMLEFITEADTLYVSSLDRLARNTMDLLNLLDSLDERKIIFISDKENIDTSSPTGRLLTTLLAAIYEFERSNMLERQREGIALAKKKGKYKGRSKIQIEDLKDFDKNYQLYMNREITKTKMAENLDISRPTLNRLLKIKMEN